MQIDTKFKSSKLMHILCGSSMSFMENQVLDYKSPLYGRRTEQFKISPFDFFETRSYYRDFDPHESAAIYGITGGVPQYLELMDDSLSVEENIKRGFFDPNAFLFEEPTNLLKQEVKVELETSASTAYLKNLISLGIVKKEMPITEKSSRKTIYTIANSMFRFWYRFVPGNAALIQSGMVDRLWQKVEPQIPAFMDGVFEEICKSNWQRLSSG